MKKRLIILTIAFIAVAISVIGLASVSAQFPGGVTSYYKFDQTTGAVLDSVGGGIHNGTIVNGAGYTIARGFNGIINNSLNISATSTGSAGSYINFTNAQSDCLDLNCSISGWINYTTSEGVTFFYIGSEDLDNRNRTIFQTSAGALSMTYTNQVGSGVTVTSSGGHNNSQWQHIVGVINTTDILLYINGTLEGFTPLPAGTVGVNIVNLRSYIGAQANTGGGVFNFFPRQTDEFGIWNRTLNATDVSDLFNSGNAQAFTRIELKFPSNDSGNIELPTFFSADVLPISGDLINGTLFIWNSTGQEFGANDTTLTGIQSSINQSFNLTLGRYEWNYFVCSDGGCEFANSNFTINYGFELNTETFSSPVAELTSQTFTYNITLISGLSSFDGILTYNSTEFISTATTVGDDIIYTRTIISPSVNSQATVPFTFELDLKDGVTFRTNVSSGNQVVNAIAVDFCSSNTLLIVNYTLFDEGSLALVTNSDPILNTSINVEATFTNPNTGELAIVFNHTYSNVTSAPVCMGANALDNSEYRLDITTQYSSTNRVIEFHNIQNFTLTNSTISNNISLFDLATSDSQEFLITFKDQNFLPVKDALVDITRKYIGDGKFRSVEIPKTDADGQTIGHFVLSDEIYTLIVSKEGKILGTFNNIVAFCENQATGDCKINLNTFGGGVQPEDFSLADNLAYTLTYDTTTRDVQSIFSTLNGVSTTINLTTTLFDNTFNTTVCSSVLTSSSGTITCNIPTSFDNVTVSTQLFQNGNLVASKIFSIRPTAESIFGSQRVILSLMLFFTLPLLALTSGFAAILLGIVGLIFAAFLNLYESGGFFGVGATLLWAVIAGAVIVWKIRRTE